jgi:hypothetical protein
MRENMALANQRPHRPGRFLSLPWVPWKEAFEDHDEVAIREAGVSPVTFDPGLDVLGAIIDNHAHPSRRENGVLYMREALL